MAEPNQKKRKNWGGLPENQTINYTQRNILVFRTIHPRNPADVDLTEFAVKGKSPFEGTNRKWNGDFTGRRILIEEMAPYIKRQYFEASKKTIRTMLNNFRIWWRFLDTCHDIAPVFSVEDLNDFHGATQFRDAIPGDATAEFLKFVNMVREDRGLPILYWLKTERPQNIRDTIEREHVSAIDQYVKRRVYKTLDRWKEFEHIFIGGTDWSECMDMRPQNLSWTRADAFATIAGIGVRLNKPCPSQQDCADYLHLKSKGSVLFKYYREYMSGLYPTREDVQDFFLSILIRTGWNAETLVAIDVDNLDNVIRDHPFSEDYEILQSIKYRVGIEQYAFSLKKSDIAPANLIKKLLMKTMPLRDALRAQISNLEKSIATSPENNEIYTKLGALRTQAKSVWIHIQRDDSKISTLCEAKYARGKDGRTPLILFAIQGTNQAYPGVNIPSSFTLKDLRGAYIAGAYENTGLSSLVGRLAAGHTSTDSLVPYLRKKKWRDHGEKRVGMAIESMWSEIRSRKTIDPAILRFMVEQGEISEQQRNRWLDHKDRTRVGMGCRDFKNPPKDVSPEHIEGSGCRVQRCSICSHGVVFEDSADHLTRRLCELNVIKSQIPLGSWFLSSFPIEFESIEAILEKFDSNYVKQRMIYWETEIKEGRHLPLNMEGSYGTKVEY